MGVFNGFFFQSKLLIYCIRFFIISDLKHITSFWWLTLFFIDKFFIFRLKSVICKKYTNTDDKDSKYTNAIDISPIWHYYRPYCRLFCSLYCSLFFVKQYFFFPLFIKCNKNMTLSDASRMFFSCYCFFLICHFYLIESPRGYSFCIYNHACFDFLKRSLTKIHHPSTHCFHHVSF